jgi:hypothetical protein
MTSLENNIASAGMMSRAEDEIEGKFYEEVRF